MDGASKFVRGDAMAGLLIVAINVVGGILVGVVQHKLPLQQAFSSYTIMTIGDGLVSQIPALVISIAAGLLVSKSGVEGSADKALVAQLAMNPISLGMVSAASGVIALIPGMPIIPFAGLSLGAGALAWRRSQAAAKPKVEPPKPVEAKEEPISREPGHRRREDRARLWPAAPDQRPGRPPPDRPDQGAAQDARRRVRLRDAAGAHPRQHAAAPTRATRSASRRWRSATGEVRLGKLMAMDPRGGQVELPGEHVREPAFGLPATWIEESLARGGGVPRLHHGRSGHGADHPPDRDPQGEHAGPALLRRGAEAAEGPLGRREEAGRGPDPLGRHRLDRAAGAAGAAARAGLDPRPADHPRGHRRGRAAHRLDHQPGGTGPRAARPADLLGQPRRRRLGADRHAVARLGERPSPRR